MVSRLLIFGVFGCTSVSFPPDQFRSHSSSNKHTMNQAKAPTTHGSSDLFPVDNVPTNVKFSESIAMLYVFEANEV